MDIIAYTTLIVSIMVLLLVIVLVFSVPKIRKNTKKVIIRIFKRSIFSSRESRIEFSEKLSNTLFKLSEDKVGAIITVESNEPMDEYIQIGHEINAKFSPELVYCVFYNKKSPLHDGAIIVRDGNIVSISSYFPTSSSSVDVNYGARHRAAIGISELNDSVTFVVSETSGNISIARNGKLTLLPRKITDLDTYVKSIFLSNI
jgi:diadenylate cyclase